MKREFLYIYLLGVLLVVLTAIYLNQILIQLPPPESLMEFTPTLSTKLYDVNNEMITEFYTEKRTWVPLLKIPVDLQNAVIAIEDNNFFHHWGIYPKGILRAALNNMLHRRVVAGGSTITQQLAKTAYLTQERTFTRKIKELLLSFELERNFSKQEILEMYLNQIYLGHGAYGVEQAANIYFSKHVYELSLGECAILSGLIRYPGYYSPFDSIEKAIRRRAVVLARMRQLNYITEKEEFTANKERVTNEKKAVVANIAPYFVEYIRMGLESRYGSASLYQSGWKVYTTLDMKMQRAAEKSMEEALFQFDIERYQENYLLKKSTGIPQVQGALLAMDVKTGGIRAMVGGRDFKKSQFNRVIQAYRQPGSSFKPFIYVAALENGFTPATPIDDTPLVYINDGRDWVLSATTTDYLLTIDPAMLKDPMKVWVPENYKRKYYGRVLLRKALEFSLNSCAVRVIEKVKPPVVIEYARRMGIKSPLTNTFSLALGSSDLNMLELLQAFNVFANRGIRVEPLSILRIEDNSGKVIEDNFVREDEVLSEQVSFVMTSLMEGVVQHGTGTYAKLLNRPCAGKTGTTNDFTDAWFTGYTPELIASVWIGYDDRTKLGEKKSGGVIACPIWTTFMKEALRDAPVSSFNVPSSGITTAKIDPYTGLLASTTTTGYNEIFLSGTEPQTAAPEGTTDYMNVPSEESDHTGF